MVVYGEKALGAAVGFLAAISWVTTEHILEARLSRSTVSRSYMYIHSVSTTSQGIQHNGRHLVWFNWPKSWKHSLKIQESAYEVSTKCNALSVRPTNIQSKCWWHDLDGPDSSPQTLVTVLCEAQQTEAVNCCHLFVFLADKMKRWGVTACRQQLEVAGV